MWTIRVIGLVQFSWEPATPASPELSPCLSHLPPVPVPLGSALMVTLVALPSCRPAWIGPNPAPATLMMLGMNGIQPTRSTSVVSPYLLEIRLRQRSKPPARLVELQPFTTVNEPPLSVEITNLIIQSQLARP